MEEDQLKALIDSLAPIQRRNRSYVKLYEIYYNASKEELLQLALDVRLQVLNHVQEFIDRYKFEIEKMDNNESISLTKTVFNSVDQSKY